MDLWRRCKRLRVDGRGSIDRIRPFGGLFPLRVTSCVEQTDPNSTHACDSFTPHVRVLKRVDWNLRNYYRVCREAVSCTLKNCGTNGRGRFCREKLDSALTREAKKWMVSVLRVVEGVQYGNVEAVLFRVPKYAG